MIEEKVNQTKIANRKSTSYILFNQTQFYYASKHRFINSILTYDQFNSTLHSLIDLLNFFKEQLMWEDLNFWYESY